MGDEPRTTGRAALTGVTPPAALTQYVAQLEARVRALEEEAAERAAVIQELRASERMLRLVMDTIPQRLFWKGRDFRFLGCNRRFAEDAGVTPDALIGTDDFAQPWRENAALYRADDVAVIDREEERIGYEEPLVRGGDGQRRWLRTSKVPLRDESGAVIGVFGCYEDITEARAAREALVASESRYRTIYEHCSDAIFVIDAEGAVLAVNPAVDVLFGWNRDELVGRPVVELIAPEDLAREPIALDLIRRKGRVLRERRMKRRDGSWATVEVSVGALPDGTFLGVVRDITERRRLEGELRHAQRLETLGRLAGGVAHDFNNVLTVVQSCAELAQRRYLRGEDAAVELTEIRLACERAQRLTRQLLTLSRREPLRSQELDLGQLVRGAEGMLASLAGDAIALQLELAEGLRVRSEPARVEQVLLNLAMNARDAMPAGGRLVVRVRLDQAAPDEEPWVALDVTDTGVGMTSATLERALEPFFTTKEAGQGTGLGLATVHQAVAQVGGRITLDSAPGEGTTVTLRFPSVAPASGSGPCVVLAEDDAGVRYAVERLLRRAGYRVHAARDGEEALRLADAAAPRAVDALVTDLMLQGMSAAALAARLRRDRPQLPVVLLASSTPPPASVAAVLAEGPFVVVKKPFEAAELLSALGGLLAR